MAESAVFSLASKILSTIASPTFDKAYERGLSIWEARDELGKLRVTIETIQAVLLDAEKKQESSVVKNLIKRLKGVLYDADDLFDEVATDDLLKQQMIQGNKKVRVFCSKFNPIVSRHSIAKKVKPIRKSLGEISADMDKFEFVRCQHEEPIFGVRKGRDPGCFVDAKDVIGRDEDKKALLEMLFNESDNAKPDFPVVIAIVGIGGIGKTTLAQLIYNDDEVGRNFEAKWFACISDISDEKAVLGKISQSIRKKSYSDLTVGQLQDEIRELIEGKKFLLVLDDVWDENHDRCLKRMKLLNCGAKGSKIIVTTRSLSVALAVGALETRKLGGLSEDDSWDLFKRLAFAPGNENDPRRIELGREFVKKCANVPLAIRSIGSLLFEKNTIPEWEFIRDEKLPKLGQSHEDGIMPVLKLSYDHLPSNQKQCFAYCSLFPKDFWFYKEDLIYLWMAQGYIKQNNEDAGHSDFMYLLRRGFFQKAKENEYGEIMCCKMHDLIHDLAQHVAGEESIMLTASPNKSNSTRHASVKGNEMGESWAISASVLNANRLRSWLLLGYGSICNPTLLVQLFQNFKRLRALRLRGSGIENVPSSIGELKHLRYLDLSENKFKSLPDSITNLVNLLTLDISTCRELKALPDDLRKLINLRYLNIQGCVKVKHMPAGIEEMSCLQHLSDFKVGRRSIEEKEIKVSGLDQLARLEQLRGDLRIRFEDGISDWDGDECWQLPVFSRGGLMIWFYPGRRIPRWGINGRANNLASLQLLWCKNVKYLPPLRCLPNLRFLFLGELRELEYMEDGDSCTTEVVGSSFFPRLEELWLWHLPKLKGWWSEVATSSSTFLSFPLLSRLRIKNCPQLKSIPLCPLLQELFLTDMDGNEVIQQLLSQGALIRNYPGRRIPSWGINGRANNLASLCLRVCKNVKYLPPLRCLPNLRCLYLDKLVELEYMEDGDSCTTEVVGSSSFFPRLEKLELHYLLKLKGWWSEEATSSSTFLSFPLLWRLSINYCPQLKSIPLCPLLQELYLTDMDGNEVIQQLLSNKSNTSPASPTTPSLSSFFQQILISPLLEDIHITGCSTLEVIHLTPPNLRLLWISSCPRLNQLHIAHPNILEDLLIEECSELELWESQDKRGVDWDSLSNLRLLGLDPLPPPEKLPDCLRHRQSHGQLEIIDQLDLLIFS